MKKNYVRILIPIIAALFVGSACQRDSNHNQDSSNPAEIKKPVEFKETLPNGITLEVKKITELREDRSNFSEFKENLNSYNLKITIPEALFTADLQIVRSSLPDAIDPKYEPILKNQAVFQDGAYIIQENVNLYSESFLSKKLSIRFFTKENLIVERQVPILPDLVISRSEKPLTLSDLGISSGAYYFGVIFFEKGSVLITEGAHIELFAERIFADQAVIESFSESFARTPSAKGQAGINGGLISLKAKTGLGSLSILMRGTKGGKGFSQTIPAPDNQTPGTQGRAGEFQNTIPSSCESSCNTIQECSLAPGDGLQGPKGFMGLPGGDGFAGGASGSLYVEISETLGPMEVFVSQVPGEGGEGGDGGPGGRGGPGGPPGNMDKYGACKSNPPAKYGPFGPSGDPGLSGKMGPEGLKQENRVVIAGRKIN